MSLNVKCFFQIMAEPYESIGNRVMRHFRHVIDSTAHYWLPGNHIEQLGLGEDIPGPSGLAHQSTSSEIPPSVDPHVAPSSAFEFHSPEEPARGQTTKRGSTEELEEHPKTKKRRSKTVKESSD